MVLNKQMKREFKRNLFRYIGILLLIIIGIAVVTGYNCTARSVLTALNDAKESGNVEDGDFQVNRELEKAQLQKIKDMGFDVEKQFYCDYEHLNHTLRIFQVRETMNLIERTKGSTDIGEDEIFLDRKYAEAKGYDIGDTLEIEGRRYIVKGMGCVPDYILIISDLTSNSSDADEFGLAFLNKNEFEKLSKDDITYNYAFSYDESWSEEQQDEKVSELREYLKDECEMTGFLKNADSTRVIGIFSKLDSDKSTAVMLGAVIILIIAFLFFTVTKSTIAKECSAIGTLYAQGFLEKEIRRYYIKLPLLLTLVGTIIGYILGSRLMMEPLIESSYAFYCIPNITLVPSVTQVAATIILPVVLVFIINELGLIRLLNAEPLQLLRNDLQGAKKRKFFGRKKVAKEKKALEITKKESDRVTAKIFDKLPFFTKFRLRVIFKGISDNILLMVGIILSCFLMTMGIGMHDSITKYIEKVENSVPSKYVYLLKSEIKADEKEAEKLKSVQFHYYFEEADTKMPITCYGIIQKSVYVDADIPEGEGVIISDVVANKFGFCKGDKITLESSDGNDTYEVEIKGICDYANGLYMFMNISELNKLIGDKVTSYNAYFSDKKLDIPDTYISGTITKKDIIESAKQYYDMTSSTVSMMIVAAMIIAVILMFIIFEMTIDKNKTNISLTKILGYMPKELNKIYIGGKIFVVLFGLLIAIPLDIMLMKSMWPSLILTFRGFMPFEIVGKHILVIVVVEVAAYFAIRWITSFTLEKVELMHVLKDRG